jgi:hypothetical protein
MRPGSRSRFTPRKFLLWSAPLAWLGCGGGGTDVTLPSLRVTTTTTGIELDADGYTLVVGDATGQPIGLDATLTIERLPEGPHSVALTGLAANCAAADNPRAVTVQAAATANVSFAVTCGATSGTIEVATSTSGPGSDPDGYALLLDGAERGPIGATATMTLVGLTPGAHVIGLTGLAANCQVGENPRNVTVMAGQTAQVPFAVTCAQPPATSGSVRITTETSGSPPDPDGYRLRVDSGTEQGIGINTSLTLSGLSVGQHTILLGGLAANCRISGENPRRVTVAQEQTAAVSFTITCVPTGSSINLRIEGMSLTQSTQRPEGDVPLVQGREGFLRVFVTASGSNSARPSVRVRFLRSGAPSGTLTIPAPSGSTPTVVTEGTLNSSWNIPVPASLIRPGVSVLAEVDPSNAIAETDEDDNSFPVSGPRALTVRAVPAALIRFVRVLQTTNGLQGEVGDPNELTDLARRMYPLNDVRADVRSAVFTASGPLQPNDENHQWGQILGDLEAARLAEASDRIYFGIVKLDYTRGLHGVTFPFLPQGPATATSLGWDEPSDVKPVVAHELGHIWGQQHSSCGGAPDPDPNYPYANGSIGTYGMDLVAGRLMPPSSPNIMGYCANPWVSDYTYARVLAFREDHPLPSGAAQPTLLIWGRIVNGRPVLEPAFQIVTRPSLPNSPGPYSIQATASDGTPLFSFSFDAAPIADHPQDTRSFAFAVPLDAARTARLRSLRLSAPGGAVTASTRPPAQFQRAGLPDSVVARRDAAGVALSWNPSVHPMIMVRDPETGEVLSFARGGNSRVWTAKGEVVVEMSDGVKSQRLRLAIRRW